MSVSPAISQELPSQRQSRWHILACADSYCGIAVIGDRWRAVSYFVDSGSLEHFHVSLFSTAFRASCSLDFTHSDDSLVYISWER
jgi:hypothetical protein